MDAVFGVNEDLAGSEPGAALARLIVEAIAALTHLDSTALDELTRRAEALAALESTDAIAAGTSVSLAIEHDFRLFAGLLKATGDNLAALRRAESQQTYGAHLFGGQGLRASEPLPPDAYGASHPLFERFELYDAGLSTAPIRPRPGAVARRGQRDAFAQPAAGYGSGPA